MNALSFSDLGLAESLQRALRTEKYETPTPIQAQAIPALLQGRDMIGIAQTGTGKTAAFGLPLLQRLAACQEKVGPRQIHALILAPTRELAVQIGESLAVYGRNTGLRNTVIVGGVGMGGQVKSLARGVDILIATPGRLLDHVHQGNVQLGKAQVLILDEADRMLDMGFIPDVRRIIAKLPRERQSLMFSATMPKTVAGLAGEILKDPVRVEVTPEVVTVDRIAQHVIHVNAPEKRQLLIGLLKDPKLSRVIVFTRTKRGANKVAESLESAGVTVDAIHGNKSQNARQRALDQFRCGKVRVLVATAVAARGIDVDGISHVVNYELPADATNYVHRIGRTARAGTEGIALSFCDSSERGVLKDIEKLTRRPLAAMPIPFMLKSVPAEAPDKRQGSRDGRGRSDEQRRPDQAQYKKRRRRFKPQARQAA